MLPEFAHPVPFGAGAFVQSNLAPAFAPVADAFERLPVNLSSDEISAMVADIIG